MGNKFIRTMNGTWISLELVSLFGVYGDTKYEGDEYFYVFSSINGFKYDILGPFPTREKAQNELDEFITDMKDRQ